jgi:hypothetical protein
MKRTLIAAVALIAIASAATQVAAAEKRDHRQHQYYWIETPAAPPANGCDVRILSYIVNRGDVCPAADTPLVPPFVVQ